MPAEGCDRFKKHHLIPEVVISAALILNINELGILL